ncbi:MAG: L-rhamnose mutarotase [Chitinophagaceae bacterium]|nr:L-rhamnose mutarotase [Chitinophagaceae bacterium]
MPKRLAFRMTLYKGFEEEYERRHAAIWPELQALLKETGISNYSIFLDKESCLLIGVMKVENETSLDDLAKHPVMKRWWDHMKDIMETHQDHSPVSIALKEVFFLG